MNTIFYVSNGKVFIGREIDPVQYINNVNQIASDCIDELTMDGTTREEAEKHMNENWRPYATPFDLDAGEENLDVSIPEELWIEYRDDVLSELF